MCPIKYNILYFIVLNIIVQIQSLIKLPPVEDNEIAITESALRSTVNSLFSTLKLKRGKHKERIREFSTIHNFFVSITLQDHDNLKEIAKLARVDNIDNNTQNFITQLNEVLNEDNKSNEALDDAYVNTYVETFIKRLEYMKYMNGFKNNIGNFNINAEILNTDTTDLDNVAKGIKKTNNTDGNQSDDEFWKPSGRRIYEGHRVKIKRYPFMASVQFFKKFQCGGSIIQSDLVITSASCLQLAWNNRFFRENPAFLSVQVGCDFYEGGGENIAVQEVHFHPEYNPKNLNNNLALMRLRRTLHFDRREKRVKKIEIDRNPWKLPETTAGITVIGWGARSSKNIPNEPWTNRLSFAVLDFYSLSECQEVYSKDYVTNKNFCAGFVSKGGGACNRDVGGPGVASGILVGVVSFGSPNCGATDAPTVFTKIGYFSNWIDGIMEQSVPSGFAVTTEKPYKTTNLFNFDFMTSTHTYKTYPIVDNNQTDDAVIFKEFLRTVFNSEEIKDYLDLKETDTEKSPEVQETTEDQPQETSEDQSAETTKDKQSTKKLIRSYSKLTTQSIPITDDEIEMLADDEVLDNEPVDSVKMVTTMEKFIKFDSSHEGVIISKELNKNTDINPGEEVKIETEQNIAKLINDIVQEIIESQPTNDTQSNGKTPSESKVRLVNLSEETYESSNEDEDSGAPYVSKEGTGKKDELNIGLSIPIEPFEDLTFRQNTSGILNFLSKADLLALATEGAASTTERSIPEKYRIPDSNPYISSQSPVKTGFRFRIV